MLARQDMELMILISAVVIIIAILMSDSGFISCANVTED